MRNAPNTLHTITCEGCTIAVARWSRHANARLTDAFETNSGTGVAMCEHMDL